MGPLINGIPKPGQEIQPAQAHLETPSLGLQQREEHRAEDAAEALRTPGAQGVFWRNKGMLDYTLWHSCPSWHEGFTQTSKNTNQTPQIL